MVPENVKTYLLTSQEILPVPYADTWMNYHMCYLLTLQLNLASLNWNLFVMPIVICALSLFSHYLSPIDPRLLGHWCTQSEPHTLFLSAWMHLEKWIFSLLNILGALKTTQTGGIESKNLPVVFGIIIRAELKIPSECTKASLQASKRSTLFLVSRRTSAAFGQQNATQGAQAAHSPPHKYPWDPSHCPHSNSQLPKKFPLWAATAVG